MGDAKLIGKTIGQYEIKEHIGGGGMGQVYRAYDTGLGRDIAIKIMSADLVRGDGGYLERFKREARYSANLDHPNIVTIYTFGQQEDMTYIVMKLLNGGSLEQRIKQRPDQPASVGEIAKMLLQVGPALDHAHAKNLIHRDIKPGNIIFDDTGRAYVVDFGISKMRTADMTAGLTNANVVMGTSSYMPPEQWRGELQPASDQYALAVTLYNMLTNRLPFEATDQSALMYKIMDKPPFPINMLRQDLSDSTIAVLERALAKQPHQRWLSCSAFAEAFDATVLPNQRVDTGFFTFPVQRTPSDHVKKDNWSESVYQSPKKLPERDSASAARSASRPRISKTAALTTKTIANVIKHKNFPYYSLGGVIIFASIAVIVLLNLPSVSAPQPQPTSTSSATVSPTDTAQPSNTPMPTDTATSEPTLASAVGGTVRALNDVQLRKDTSQFIINAGTLAAGETAEILAIEDARGITWFHVRTTDGVEGWAAAQDFEAMP